MIQKLFGVKRPYGSDDPYNFSAIESLDEFKSIVADATLIMAVDKYGTNKGNSVVFGLEVIQAIANEVIPPQQMVKVVFGIDWSESSKELENLLAHVEVVKRLHDYQVSPETKKKKVRLRPRRPR